MNSPESDLEKPPTPEKWVVDEENDTGPNDDSFYRWWTVSKDTRSFRCDDEHNAKWLAMHLNNVTHLIDHNRTFERQLTELRDRLSARGTRDPEIPALHQCKKCGIHTNNPRHDCA